MHWHCRGWRLVGCTHSLFKWSISHCLKPVSPLNRAKSGKIGHFQIFEVCILVPAMFWFLVVCMAKMWSDRGKKVAEKIPGIKITRYYLRRHLHRVINCRRHLSRGSPQTPEKFERKLHLCWLKKPLIKLQKSFCFCNFN